MADKSTEKQILSRGDFLKFSGAALFTTWVSSFSPNRVVAAIESAAQEPDFGQEPEFAAFHGLSSRLLYQLNMAEKGILTYQRDIATPLSEVVATQPEISLSDLSKSGLQLKLNELLNGRFWIDLSEQEKINLTTLLLDARFQHNRDTGLMLDPWSDAILSPTTFLNTKMEFKLSRTRSLNQLFVGDILASPSGQQLLVTAVSQGGGQTVPAVDLMSFESGSKLFRAYGFSQLSGWSGGQPVSVYRNELSDYFFSTRQQRLAGEKQEFEIPPEIRRNIAGTVEPSFTQMKEVQGLRDDLENATSVTERSKILSQLVGLLGLWTKNSKGLEETGKRWQGNDPGLCNVWVSELMAIIFEKPPYKHIRDGQELTAKMSWKWMNCYGREYGFCDTRGVDTDLLLQWMGQGYMMLGFKPNHDDRLSGHSFAILPGADSSGRAVPWLSQATNHSPLGPIIQEKEDGYKLPSGIERSMIEEGLDQGILWAIPLPGASTVEVRPSLFGYAQGFR